MSDTNLYNETIKTELANWQQKIMKKPTVMNKYSKSIQGKVQDLVPEKVQHGITVAIKTMVETVVTASSVLTDTEVAENAALSESDFLVERMYKTYYKVAMAQGIGFGMGGMLINLADLPALLLIKVKFLFDCAKLYGFDIEEKSERLFMLHIFQLAFCGDEHKVKIAPIVMNWETHKHDVEVNWRELQIEYRDYMDITKLLQILPVVGAAAGGFANHNLMQKLKITAMNSYRWRIVTTMVANEKGGLMMRKQEKMWIVSQHEISNNIFELVLQGDLVSTMLQAGQFVNVRVGDGNLILRRPISICNINHEKSQLTLIYRADGSGTKVLSQKKAGEYVDILGPLGSGFNIDKIEAEATVVLAGGGIGVPPMYETAKRLSARGYKVIAVLGFSSKEDVFYEDKFKKFSDVRIATMDGSYGYKGHVVGLIQDEGINFDWILGCGPRVMLNAIATVYGGSKKGFLSFEERMACGIGACYACICEMADGTRTRVCKEGPVYEMSEVNV